MKIYIVIPVHNEEATIARTLQSLIRQTVLPNKLVIVNDNSSDKTEDIVNDLVPKHNWMHLLTIKSDDVHLPGTKVVNAFYKGLETLDQDYDIICKFDADLVFPENYLEKLISMFSEDENLGIAGGLLYVRKNKLWVYERIASKNHVRGPVKAYRKACFKEIGGLKPCIGWDTIDTYLSQYNNWTVRTDDTLHVSHLKPRGHHYSEQARLLEGERWYNMRYGFVLGAIASLKSAIKAKSLLLFIRSITGYRKAKTLGKLPFVTVEEGQFIRKLIWKNIRRKYFKF